MMSRHRRAAAATAAVAVATLAAVAAPGRAAPGNAAKGWQAPVLISANQAARETSIALSPKDPNLMVVCDPSGVPNIFEGQSYFHRSTNGGKSWAFLPVETAATDTRKYAFEGGDCDVAFDRGGTLYAADTWLGDLSVGNSRDGGKTWEGTALATTSPVVDRPWLVGGPAGTVYLSFQDLQCCTPAVIWFTKSTDGGKTFLPAVPVTTAASTDGGYTWEGNFVVSPDGRDLYLVHSRRMTPGLTNVDGEGPETIWIAESHDGGLTWTTKKIATLPQRTTSIYPAIGLDKAGYLHVVYSAPRDGDVPVWYTISTDKGQTWRTPKPLAPGTTGVAPWIVGGKAGQAAITWLGSPDPAALGSDDSGWFFYWARVTESKGTSKVRSGRTTTKPIYTGPQIAPEFEMVALDAKGRMNIGYLLNSGSGPVPARGSVQAFGPSLSHRLPTIRRVALSWPARVGRC